MAAGVLLLTGTWRWEDHVMRRVAERLVGEGPEVLHRDRRARRSTGFRVVGFEGTERVIAHMKFPKIHRVGKYGVDVPR